MTGTTTQLHPRKSMCIDDVPTCEEHWKSGGSCTPNCVGCSPPRPATHSGNTSAEKVLDEKIKLLKTIEGALFKSIIIRGTEITVVNSLFSNHIQKLRDEVRGERERG